MKKDKYGRMSRPPFPIPLFIIGTKVEVFMGAGFSRGFVVSSSQEYCQVRLAVGNRVITVRDARSIRKVE